MKKIRFLLLVILGSITINSCETDEIPEPVSNKGITAEKTDVKTYEIINLITHTSLADKYNATFGSAPIELLKTSDSTLTFYVPDIAEGETSLIFDLATIKFNVTKTAEVNANQLIANWTQKFDDQVRTLNPSNPDQIAEINSLNQYKQEVISLFNSLTNDERRQTVLFYEANKDIFNSFANSTFTNLDAATTMRLQSECPRTDFKSFYGCTAENLGDAAIGLKNASKEFLIMLALAGVSAYLAPASFGLSAFGTTLALGTAAYLFITEVRPAALHFKYSLFSFLNANWIFSKALFQATTEVFQDQISTSLNLKPKFRTITSNDRNVNSGGGYFISAMTSLSVYWYKLTAIFGNFPAYKNTEEPTTLATNEVSISNISNSNVQYLGNTGQSVNFKSLSGNEENFSYNIRVSKEGFVEEKTLNAIVTTNLPIKLIANSISNAGVHITEKSCYGGPFNIYYLNFNYFDNYNLIDENLSNFVVKFDYETNGCATTYWNTFTFPPGGVSNPNFWNNYPMTYTSTTINVPAGLSLGDDNSDWCFINVYFTNTNNERISNIITFEVRRNVNYP